MSKVMDLSPIIDERVTETAIDAAVVTASDSTADANGPFQSLYNPAVGNIKLTTLAGSSVLFIAVPVGILKVGCTRVWSTGTTVTTTQILGLK